MINIRKAEINDLDTIVRFQLAMAFETEEIELDKIIVAKGVKAVFEDPAKGFYMIAETKGQVVASMLMTREWSDWRNAEVLWFQSVYVLPEFRRKNIFRKMYNFMWDMVQNNGSFAGLRLYVYNLNTDAQKVYEKLGMEKDYYQLFEKMKTI